LSGGQQQRVALARAIVVRPAVLLLDEPLSNLDLKLREEMRFELKGLHRDLGTTAVYVTHDQTEALVLSTRIAVMRHGRIEQIGDPQAIYERPATRFVAEFVGSTNLFRGRPAVRDGDLLAVDTSGGFRVWCRLDGAAPAGIGGTASDSVVVSVRPEQIRAIAALPSDANGATARGPVNVVPGRIGDVVYLGGTVRYTVRLSGDETVAVEEPHYPGRPVHAPGSAVRLEFDAAHCRLFADE
jgi:ABC-type Fe3+/spermidine/putrescine transport system ATPase subunit